MLRGQIPAFKVGTHTRLKRDAVLQLRHDREKSRGEALDGLRALDEELLTTVDPPTE